jgi:hypothetical protein
MKWHIVIMLSLLFLAGCSYFERAAKKAQIEDARREANERHLQQIGMGLHDYEPMYYIEEPQSDTRPGVDPNIFNLDAETIQELQPIQRVYPNNIEFDLEIPQQLQSIPVTELDPNIFKSKAEIPQEQ